MLSYGRFCIGFYPLLFIAMTNLTFDSFMELFLNWDRNIPINIPTAQGPALLYGAE